MKASKYLKILFVLGLLTLCLPWFTYNAKVMGYRYGFAFWKWFAMPNIVLVFCLFWPERKLPVIVLGEIGCIANFAVLVCALGLWQQVCNIKPGFRWLEGVRTALPGYWIALSFFILFFFCFQIELIKGQRKAAGYED